MLLGGSRFRAAFDLKNDRDDSYRDVRYSTCHTLMFEGMLYYIIVHRFMMYQDTHRNQSTAMMRVMSSVGSPTEVSTITMVTRPA